MGEKKLSSVELDFFLWQEFRMLRLELAKQPLFLREAIMNVEERVLFLLIESGSIYDILAIRKRGLSSLKESIIKKIRYDLSTKVSGERFKF